MLINLSILHHFLKENIMDGALIWTGAKPFDLSACEWVMDSLVTWKKKKIIKEKVLGPVQIKLPAISPTRRQTRLWKNIHMTPTACMHPSIHIYIHHTSTLTTIFHPLNNLPSFSLSLSPIYFPLLPHFFSPTRSNTSRSKQKERLIDISRENYNCEWWARWAIFYSPFPFPISPFPLLSLK